MVNEEQPQEQEPARKKGKTLIFALWALVAIFIAGMFLYSRFSTKADPCPGTVNVVGGDDLGGDFTALWGDQAVTQDEVITEPSLIYFGYTFCPDVCPIDTARNAEITDALAERGVSITPVFVTVDPKRDTADVMKEYAYYTHDKMIGLSGSDEEIEHLKSLYRVVAQQEVTDDEENYLVNHTAFSYLVDGDNNYIATYARSQRVEEIADNIQCQIEHLDD